jgi:hypothetical protein
MINKFFKKPAHLILFALIFIIGIFSRFYNIQKIPTFIYQDEMGYLISAISMNLSGTDITGTWNPLSLSPVTPSIAALDEATTQFIFPFYKLPINNILAGKLPFILISLIVPFLIAGISYEFTNSKPIAKWAWLISMFNPWIWQMGRMSVDPFVSFFFYTAGAYLVLKLNNWKKLWSLPLLFFGFYHYQGHKLVFIFWVLIFCIYSVAPYIEYKKGLKKLLKSALVSKFKKILPSLLVFLLSSALFIFYVFFQLPTHGSSQRLNSFFTPDSPEIAEIVNEDRRMSLDSPLNSILINKYTVWTSQIFERLTETYGYKFLFLEGQIDNAAFSVWNHGIFYIIDSVLIFFGLVYLLSKKRYGLLTLLIFGLLVTVIPSLISGSKAYFYRSSLNIPLLIILASIGTEYLKSILPKYTKYLIYFIYAASIFYFSYIYFVRYPLLSSTRQYFTDRVLVEYLTRVPLDQEVIVLVPELEFSVSSYLFYTDYLNHENISEVQKMFQEKKYRINNITFTTSCIPSSIEDTEKMIFARWDVKRCDLKTIPPNSLQIKDIKDNGTIFNIYNDKLCSGQKLNSYSHIHKKEQFDFDKQSDSEFCSNWVSKFVEP